MRSKPSTPRFARGLLAAILSLGIAGQALADVTLLNVSYDPTRELYQDYNAAFANTGRTATTRWSPSSSPTAAPASRPAR